MKNVKWALAAAISFGSLQGAKANSCNDDYTLVAVMMIGTVTLAPTGTTFLTTGAIACRDRALILKEDATEYRMSGQMTPVLKSGIEAAQKHFSDLDEETIVSKLIDAKID